MSRRRLQLLVCLSLIVATVGAYWQVRNHDFVNYDDDIYITENRYVQADLTWEGIIWAFTTTHASNWHPLTWLSHVLDCQIYGLNSGRHHVTSLLFHVVNTLLLFVVLKRTTGALWRSALVAALFALHPLHVESVAWVAERKDVLSTFFWMITIWGYIVYVERPGFGRYLLVLVLLALGLMAKPMLVTLPFVLLLLDYWPLGRFQFGSGERQAKSQKSMNLSYQMLLLLHLVREKIPFFAVAAVSCVVTFLAQQSGGALTSLDQLPLNLRVANAVVSYVSYMGKIIWPHHLAVIYPHPGTLPIWQAAAAGLLLVCISVFVIRAAQRSPYLLVGWLWYIGTLVPVIGLVQVGSQAMADRYTYVPLIGLFIVVAWGVADLVARWPYRRLVLATSAGLVLSVFTVCTWLQVSHWRHSIALFKHTLDVTANNHFAHNNLANALAEQGKLEEAVSHCRKALQIKPKMATVHNNMGMILYRQGKFDEAIAHYSEALQIKPDYADAHNNLGAALHRQGKFDEAIAHFSEALWIMPDYADAHNNVAVTYYFKKQYKLAIQHCDKAVELGFRVHPGFLRSLEAHR